MCLLIVSLFAVNVAQVCEGAAEPSGRAGTKRLQRAFVEVPSHLQVTLFPRYVALLIEGPGGPTGISDVLKDLRRFTEPHLRAQIVALDLCDICQIVQTASGG